MRESDWSSDVCSSDLEPRGHFRSHVFLETRAQIFGQELFRAGEHGHVVHGACKSVPFVGGHQVLNEVFPKPPPAEEFAFFPYEIQIMDVKAYADSIFGMSNHEEYRRKQSEVARNRVFGRAVPLE